MLARAGGVASRANAPPLTERSTRKPDSFVALSRHVRLTCGPAASVAVRVVGAAGALTPRVAEVELAVIVGNPFP